MPDKLLKYLFIFALVIPELVSAQFYFFGRNKVQYEEFEWKVIKTEHFNIYYYGEFRELAEIGANYAEEAFDELKVKFNHIITSRIPLIFYNTHIHFQQTNTLPGFIPEGVGGFFEFLKGRVVIPYLGALDQFEHVIRHELVHVFMTSKVFNNLKDHRTIGDRYPPLWFVEGLAEYWSYYSDTQAEMVMRDAVLNNIFVPLSNINLIYGSFLMYKEGQSFLEFVASEYGEDKILLLLENFWRFTSFTEVIEFTLNESIEDIDKKWHYTLKQKYFPLFADKFPFHIGSKKLTNAGFNFSPNYLDRDSTEYIYFIGNHSGYSSVFRLPYQPESKEYIEPEVLIEGENEAVFESFHLLQTSITVSNNGLLAFVAKSRESDVLHLYSIDSEEVIKSFKFKELLTIQSPKFSADEKFIVFSATDRKGFKDIFILSLESGEITRLTNDYYSDKDPVFGKNDSLVIFSSDRTEGKYKSAYNLFSYNLETYDVNYLTYVDANLSTPHFTPDFSELYFNADYDGTNNIWKLEVDEWGNSYGMTQYTQFVTSVFDFTFVNNHEIVTSGFESFSFQFYAMDLNNVPDSLKNFVEFEFEVPRERWFAKKIDLPPSQEEIIYRKEYTLDYAVSQVIADPVYGTRGGAIMTLSDLMGDDRYFFLIYNTAEVQSEILRNFNVSISRINSFQRANFGYGIFHFSGRRYDIRESDDYFYERTFGGFLSLIYPLSSFQRIEASVSLAKSNKEDFAFLPSRKALLLANYISFVHDNSLWGPTGPLDGSRFRLMFGYTSDIKYSNVNYLTAIFDYRKYFRVGLRSSLAFRGSFFINHGKEARRYIAGGSWDLRGYPRWSLRGEKLWISSLELRFPLIDNIYLRLPFFGIALPGIRGALFFDSGNAWDEEYTKTLGSLGVGFRFNFFNVITFRYDMGKKIEDNFSKFQNGLFYQFFFGWDF